MNIEKYNGCGNNFIIVPYEKNKQYSQLAQRLCQDKAWNTDGFIVVKTNPLEMIFYNRDGSQAPMCGNGIRCFAYYAYRHHLISHLTFSVVTLAGIKTIEILTTEPFTCRVKMGQGNYDLKKVGLSQKVDLKQYVLPLKEEQVTVSSLFLGTVHTVVFVKDVNRELNQTRGKEICLHPYFKHKTNVNFVELLPDQSLKVRTYERGVGWTLACGTGCCASYVVATQLGKIPIHATPVFLPQGTLMIEGKKEIYMSGPAVFEKIV